MIEIRREQPDDCDAVRMVNGAAFEQPDEADLVDRLREVDPSYLALVALLDGEVVGHIAFSRMTPGTSSGAGGSQVDIRGLAPMAVHPEHQRTGIGSQLVREGLEACRSDGADAVVVLGHPEYYPRFGFEPAHRFGLATKYDVAPEAFMAIELTAGGLDDVEGIVRYHAEFLY